MIGISSHDAGGAELLSEYVAKNKNNYLFFISGPAVSIFKKKIKNLKISNFDNSYKKLKKVITSTGWATNKEITIIDNCKKKKIKVCAYLDHWCNYKERFILNKKLILPDEIWVSDSLAYNIAKKIFKKKLKLKIKKIKNFYFAKAKKFFKENKYQKKNKENNILYLCEPIDEHYKNKYFYNEKDCLNLFFEKSYIFKKINTITFRPHPYEKNQKYKWLIGKPNFKIKISKKNTLFREIIKNDIIVGCNTVALYIGLLANKKVYTSIPKGFNCDIPSKKIIYLNNF